MLAFVMLAFKVIVLIFRLHIINLIQNSEPPEERNFGEIQMKDSE